MLFLILLSPLIGFLSGSLFGRFLGKNVCYTTTSSLLVSLLFSSKVFYDILLKEFSYKLYLVSWVSVDTLNVDWSFHFDSLTTVMLIVVTFISFLVHVYSIEYMGNDPHLPRFMSYLSLFTFFMLIMITANNFLQLFVGWEGVGLCSYLLINFWFTRTQANKASIKAMLVNRIGDFSFLLALFTIFFSFNSLDFDIIFNLVPEMSTSSVSLGFIKIPVVDIICMLLFIGAMGKSAQLGLHTWLPDAMEGPTPVSALIHAATMVTAGIFLIIRCSFLFEYSPTVLNVITVLGASTAFFASTTGLFQNDIKKVIAYSTCSQLGYMMFSCGLSNYEISVFHLSNHAFFKALLFLAAGSVIHSVTDEQDMRKMGGLKNVLPFSYTAFLVGSMSLMGFPFLTGFYSKDTILEAAYSKFSVFSHFSFYLGCFGAFFTSFYSIRLLFLVFLSASNNNRATVINAHESSSNVGFTLLLLSIFSVIVGFFTRDFFIGFGTNFWNSSIFILPSNYIMTDIEFAHLFFKLFPLIMSILGGSLAYFLYGFGLSFFYVIKKTVTFKIVYNFLNRKWYFDRIYNQFICQKTLNISYEFTYKDIDRGLIEKLGPSNVVVLVYAFFSSIKEIQTGRLFHYLLMFLINLIFLMLIIIFPIGTISSLLSLLLFLFIYFVLD
jgi:proton-translocating NADH-quinone oxidoreductase chain L